MANTWLTVQVPKETKNLLKKIAKSQHVSVSDYLRQIIREALAKESQ